MVVRLEKPLKRGLSLNGRLYVLVISPAGLKLTIKGRRKGLELAWENLVSGEAALATALNASLGQLGGPSDEENAGRAPRAPKARRSP